mmetsp:Transcript_18929/g.28331  ORF Transcript_18929/g.28331 Transcript_18929/m.28331 type:complete len:157 (-) Transcript_18929:136-606(-)|eukprot:CAMPEP_0167745956 /NCGR_PEP_ID=MMETSP0110_2-20121227/3439_1 /TAXON_ID=629695 /ORGANISM="Gymnochlora sp., Strain CCMP2014" /LENGTH=156 /DNA_ID=CAMNT_0007630655 /DNA_START=274 /DNA_END=741 /DNA_ORIENTATION=+
MSRETEGLVQVRELNNPKLSTSSDLTNKKGESSAQRQAKDNDDEATYFLLKKGLKQESADVENEDSGSVSRGEDEERSVQKNDSPNKEEEKSRITGTQCSSPGRSTQHKEKEKERTSSSGLWTFLFGSFICSGSGFEAKKPPTDKELELYYEDSIW